MTTAGSIQDLSAYRDVCLQTYEESASPIASLPSEVWTHIFSFLNFKDQAHVEQTCRKFHVITATAHQLRIHEARTIHRLALSIPTLQTLKTSIFDIFFLTPGPGPTYALCLSEIDHPSRLIVANKKTGIAQEIDVKQGTDTNFDAVAFAQEISPNTIIIVSSSGRISWWRHNLEDLQDRQPWLCAGEQKLDLPASHAISKICVDGQTLYIWYPDTSFSGCILDAFDLTSQKMKGRYLFPNEPHCNLDCVSSGIIYKSKSIEEKNAKVIQAIRLHDTTTEVLWKTELPSEAFFLMIGANRHWIVVKGINVYSWTILEAATGKIYWHYVDLPKEQEVRGPVFLRWDISSGPIQLYNDVVVSREGNKVQIWDIFSRTCCANLDLQQLHPMVLPFEIPPIVKIAFVNDELLICFHDKKGIVQIAQFSPSGVPNKAVCVQGYESRLMTL